MLEHIQRILEACGTENEVFPATELYNEGWMLRIILDWFSHHPAGPHPLCFSLNARWYSEALLPSPFLAKYRGDSLSESWTHADGVVGHFGMGETGRGDLSISADPKQIVVLEAKIFSKLSSGVTHAKQFDQAARSVACVAEVLKRGNRPAKMFSQLGFYVLAPSEQIKKESSFKMKTSKDSIRHKVEDRVSAYANRKDEADKNKWFNEWFLPVLEHIDIRCLSWEEVISCIEKVDTVTVRNIREFYQECLRYNRPGNHKSQV